MSVHISTTFRNSKWYKDSTLEFSTSVQKYKTREQQTDKENKTNPVRDAIVQPNHGCKAKSEKEGKG